MHHKLLFTAMKTAIVLFTLFFQAAADPDPTQCCTPRQYSIVYNETAEDDPSHNRREVYLAADFDKKLMISQSSPDSNRVIEDYQQRKKFIIYGNQCVWVPLSDENVFPDSSCLTNEAKFIKSITVNGETMHVWNYTIFGTKFTSTVHISNCLPDEERIEKPPNEVFGGYLLTANSLGEFCQLNCSIDAAENCNNLKALTTMTTSFITSHYNIATQCTEQKNSQCNGKCKRTTSFGHY